MLAVCVSVTAARGQAPPPVPPDTPPRATAPPGKPAPPEAVTELERELGWAIQRFESMDLEGVLATVSDRYRSGPLTKPALRQQLRAIFAAHDAVRAHVRIHDVRMIGDRAWIYSSGDVSGRLRWLGTLMPILEWEREPEVAWREGGRWRLIGDQQP